MNRTDLQNLAVARLGDAKALLETKRYSGAYYLAGYVVECALKACIAKRTKRGDFPDLEQTRDAYTHNLVRLLKLSEFEKQITADWQRRRGLPERLLQSEWSDLMSWNEQSRYQAHSEKSALAMVSGADIILKCIKRYW